MRPSFLLAGIFAANSPDIDFLFGFLAGAPNRYHHQFTHSFIFAAAIGGLLAFLFTRMRKMRGNCFVPLFFYFSFLAVIHVVLDYFCVDTTPPFGVMLFWPFSQEYHISTIFFFTDIQRSSEMGLFFRSLFSQHNGLAIFREVFIIGALVLVFLWIARRYRAGRCSSRQATWEYDRE